MGEDRALRIGMCYDRSFPAGAIVEFAERLDRGGVDQLWVIEDCFYTAGVSLASAALARTERLQVGLGILPAVARNPAITAMEVATLAELAPGRLLAGIGHGVQSWMEQIGARTPSPLTTLEEVLVAVRRLLAGETVDVDGREVTLRDVTLSHPPAVVPPVLAGVRGPRSLELAGRVADGVVLAEGAGSTYVRQSLDHAGRPDGFRVAVFSVLCLLDDAQEARRTMAPFIAGLVAEEQPSILAHPHFDEIRERVAAAGVDGVATMPADWWTELGAVGGRDDVLAHIESLRDAGVTDIGLFPAPDLDLARADIETVIDIRRAVD